MTSGAFTTSGWEVIGALIVVIGGIQGWLMKLYVSERHNNKELLDRFLTLVDRVIPVLEQNSTAGQAQTDAMKSQAALLQQLLTAVAVEQARREGHG